MSGLCGWIDGRAAAIGEAPRVLDLMTAGIPLLPGAAFESAASDSRALAAGGATNDRDLVAEGPVWAAIVGQPRWTNADLAAMAKTEGHACALVASYARYETDLFEHLHGPWALAVIDARQRRGLIAIDRMAIHPLCYAITADGGLVFGTTTDSVRLHPSVGATISPQAVFDYMFLTRVPAPRTIYGGIAKLLPGEYAFFDGGEITTRPYWRLAYQDLAHADLNGLASELKAVLRRAVARATATGETRTIGSYLSGGVDSSTVTGLFAEQSGGAAAAFGVGFDSDEYDEMAYARAAARHFGIRLHEYYVTPQDIVDAAPMIAGAYDEPFGNSSALAAYYCARTAREHGVERLLAGDGGDELFAGNTRYLSQRVFEIWGRIPEWLRHGVIEPVVSGFPSGALIPPLRKARSYIRRASMPLPDRLESYNPLNEITLADCFEPEIAAEIDRDEPLAINRMHYSATRSRSTLCRMMHLDLRTVIADDDLRKVRRTAALAGVDVRFPLLDEEVVAFSAKVPPAALIKGTRLRYFFKWALRDFLAPETLRKKKHGFGLPFGYWLKTDPALQSIVYDSLVALKGRRLLRPRFIDSAIEAHRTGHASLHGELVWVLMMLELWLDSRAAVARTARRLGAMS